MSKPGYRRSTLSKLIQDARQYRRAQASDGRWYADRQPDGSVIVTHHSTQMISVEQDDTVLGISSGWASQTDKQGIGKILRGAGIPLTYWGVFYGDRSSATTQSDTHIYVPYEAEKNWARIVESSKPEPEVSKPIKKWKPPISVEDTMV